MGVDAKWYRMVRSLALVLLAAANINIAFAAGQPETETLRIDSAHSHAGFSLRALLLVSVHGKFGKVSGSIHLNRGRELGWVDAHIDARALEMSSQDREDWARSPEFFDSERYPDIHFLSDPITRTLLREGGEMRGRLTLRGIERSIALVVLPADCDQPGRDCPMHAQGSISRSDFGMRSKRAVLGDRVVLDLWVFAEPAMP